MANLKKNPDELFEIDFSKNFPKNHRIATRQVRKDITASLSDLGLLSFGKVIFVDLVDISSKGALVSTEAKVRVNKKVTLNLKFKSGKIFHIKALIVHSSGMDTYQYGIKFDRYNNELGDYLLETQSKLVFK